MQKIFHLEDSLVLYGIYNSDTLEALIDTIHRLHNHSTWNEKLWKKQKIGMDGTYQKEV